MRNSPSSGATRLLYLAASVLFLAGTIAAISPVAPCAAQSARGMHGQVSCSRAPKNALSRLDERAKRKIYWDRIVACHRAAVEARKKYPLLPGMSKAQVMKMSGASNEIE